MKRILILTLVLVLLLGLVATPVLAKGPKSGDWNVPVDFETIQEAVDAASDGDTVYISAGIYEEQVSIIGKDIMLQGAPGAIILAPVTMAANIANDRAIVYVENAEVTIRGFTVDGAGRGNLNKRFLGIYYRDAGGRIDNCIISDIRNTPFSGRQDGLGIYANNTLSSTREIFITGNVVSGFQKNGITVNGNWPYDYRSSDPHAPTYTNIVAHIVSNTIIGAGATGITAQNGVQISRGASGQVRDNSISNLAYTGGGWASTGILAYYSYNVHIQGNEIIDCDPGLYIAASTSTNVVRNQFVTESSIIADLGPWALLVSGVDNKITNNVFRDLYVGIYVGSSYYGDTSNTKLMNNRFTNVEYPIYEQPEGVEGTKEHATKIYD